MLENSVTIQHYSPKLLHHYIESINIYTFGKGMDIQLHPKGVFEVVFQSHGDFQHNTSYSSGWEARPESFIGGLHNRSYTVKSYGDHNVCIGVALKPHMARHFIPYKLHYFQNNLIEISEIWGRSGTEIAQKLHEEKTNANKIKLIEDFFIKKCIPRQASPIDRAVYAIQSSKGFVTINDLALHAGLSNAQFRKRFKEEIGISPSQYCKITRINATLSLLKKRAGSSLTELTYMLGYFDQAHFIKDFKSIIGVSPGKLLKENPVIA